jgi:hypothetical protein
VTARTGCEVGRDDKLVDSDGLQSDLLQPSRLPSEPVPTPARTMSARRISPCIDF